MKLIANNSILFLIAFLGIVSLGYSQKTIVYGKVYDATTKEALPFVNLVFKGSKIGTSSDINGNYRIETYYSSDSLQATFVGYKLIARKVKKDKTQEIDFPMQTGEIQLHEFEVKYDRRKDKNPAHEILKGVIKHKKANNKVKLDAYEYEAYNKVEFDINNIDEAYKNKAVFKPFQFIFDNIDTTDEKPYLPIFITEALTDFHYRKSPRSELEIVKASQVSGVKNESVQQFLGDMYQNVNMYENYINVFGKSFVSPIADFGLATYHYYLMDSAFIDNKWCYKLKFEPRRKHEMTFDGEMWISDTTYAVKQIQTTVSGDANINFINDFAVYQEYNEVEREIWMLTRDELVVDFTVTKKTMGLYGRKTSTYKDFVINKPREISFYEGANNVIVADSAGYKTDDFWTEARHVKLSNQEEKIYKMIDTLQSVPAFKSYIDVIQLLITGYKVIGKFEFGPYSSIYSFNQVEGSRIRFGGRTSNAFSTRLMLEGYGAYGTRDQNFKYGGGFKYFLSKKPRQSIAASYRKDVEILGVSENAWSSDNIISSVFRRTPFDKFSGVEEFKISFEREWVEGISNEIGITRRDIWGLGVLDFKRTNPDGSVTSFDRMTTAEIHFHTKIAYREKFISGEFDRISLGTKYPTIQIRYAYGVPRVFGSDFEYHKLKLNIKDKLRIGGLGDLELIGEGGKTWGDVPYPYLQIHNGNETYSYDVTSFNLMNYYEFVSDEYIYLVATHHFNGLFLNKIPLMNKLKWREVISAKGVIGSLSADNEALLNYPVGLSSLNKPYYEAGVGIENIFKILRLDLLWRLAYIDKDYIATYEALSTSNIPKWGIRGMLQFKF